MDNKKRLVEVSALMGEKLETLNPSQEDVFLINHLIVSYYKKRGGISNSKTNVMATAFLWVYSKSNFLWEHDKKWTKQKLAELFNVNPKTVGDVASKIIKALKIDLWDERFCKKEVMKDDPFDEFIMAPSGFIVPKELLGMSLQDSERQRKTKKYYFDEAMNFLEQDDEKRAIEYLNKSLVLDESYIEALNELGLIYFDRDLEKSKEYYKKSFELSKKELGGNWPEKLEWSIWENRPYMRAIQGLGLIAWREHEIEEAKRFFNLLIKMNPWDNQGIRYCLAAIYKGLSWNEFGKIEDRCIEKGDYEEQENILKEQNNNYKFWKCPEEHEQG